MSTWVIISWVCVAILTGVNIFIFRKLNEVNKQMMKMIAPNAKNMGEAMSQMQKMMGGMSQSQGMQAAMRGGKRKRGMGVPVSSMGGRRPPGTSDTQLKAAMDMLSQMQKKK